MGEQEEGVVVRWKSTRETSECGALRGEVGCGMGCHHTRQVPFGPFLFVSTPANCPSGTYIYQGLLRWREGEVADVATRWGAALWLSAARATTAVTGGGGRLDGIPGAGAASSMASSSAAS